MRVKKSQVLKLLQEGKSTREIADLLGTDIGNIQAHKHRLVKSGAYKNGHKGEFCFDDPDTALEFWANCISEARQTPTLRNRVKELEVDNAAKDNEINILRAKIKDIEDKRAKYRQALQSGDVREPIASK